jgi:hypothetical protein
MEREQAAHLWRCQQNAGKHKVDVSAGSRLYFCYRRHDVHLLRGPPGHLPGAAFFVAGGSPDSTPGDARGHCVFGPGLKCQPGRRHGAPDQEPSRCLPLMAVPGGAANDATSEKYPRTPLPVLFGHPIRRDSADAQQQSIRGRPLRWIDARAGRNPAKPALSSRANGRCHAATGLMNPVDGFCRFHRPLSVRGENTMNKRPAKRRRRSWCSGRSN